MSKRIFVSVMIVSSLSIMGCSTNIYSPPSRVNMLESAAVLADGESALAVAPGITGEVFGFSALSLTGSYKEGVGHDLEVGADANVISFDRQNSSVDLDRYIYSGRVRAKWTPATLGGNAALTGGIGGGYAPDGGAFVSPDLGIVVAFENRYLVPYLGATAYVSQPIGTKKIDVSVGDDPAGTEFDEAQFTWGYDLSAGAKLPIRYKGGQLNLHAGMRILSLNDVDDGAVAIGLMLGPELIF